MEDTNIYRIYFVRDCYFIVISSNDNFYTVAEKLVPKQ